MRLPAILLLVISLTLDLPAQAQPPAPPPALVATAPVEMATVQTPLEFIGTAEPRYLADAAAETEGLVEHLEVRQGARVRVGDPLVRLRTTRQQLLLDEARARQVEIDSRLQKAGDDVSRAEELFAQQFISREELQTRTTEVDILRGQRDQIRAAIALLEDRLRRMVIRAPFAGQVVAEKTETGQWLEAGDAALTIADLSVIHLMVRVPEIRISAIRPGQGVDVRFDALPGRSFAGVVTAVVAQADIASRTFPVQVNVANPKGEILGGMLGRVTFALGGVTEAPTVPKDALVPLPDGGSFLVKTVSGQAVMVPVRVLASVGDRFAVQPLEGTLQPGDRVVTRGNERLKPGQTLRETSPRARE